MRDRTQSIIRIGFAYFIWITLDQWSRVLLPFLLRRMRPRLSYYHIGMISSIGHMFMLLGTFLSAKSIENFGYKGTGIAICFITGGFTMLMGQTRSLSALLLTQVLRIGGCFPQVLESLIGSLHSETDGKGRLRSIMWVSLPHGLGTIAGPMMAFIMFPLFRHHMGSTYAASGILVILTLIPVILFVVPEHKQQGVIAQDTFRSSYADLLKNNDLLRILLYRLIFELPMQCFETFHKWYLMYAIEITVNNMVFLACAVGFSAVFTSSVLVNRLQRELQPQKMLTLAFGMLTVSYLGLANIYNLFTVVIACAIHVSGATMAFCLLSAQGMGCVESTNVAKTAALMQMTTMAAASTAPWAAGLMMVNDQFHIVLYLSAAVSLIGAVVVHTTGNFMKSTGTDLLPMGFERGKLE